MRRLRELVLTGAVGLSLLNLAGCDSFSRSSYPEITYPQYVENISKAAANLAKSGEVLDLESAARMYIAVGKLDEAEELASRLLKLRPNLGMGLYGRLQACRTEKEELAKSTP